MRLTSLFVILTVILSGCSTSSKSSLSTQLGSAPNQSDDRKTKTERQAGQSSAVIQGQLTEKRFKELDTILSSDVESRNLWRAKSLILALKSALANDHARQKELALVEQWVNESLGHREKIKVLAKQTRLLKMQISKHKEALKQVRRMLVSE